MLSEDSIENLIEPIITRQENINLWILTKIANRINDIGKLKPSDVYRLERLLKTGSDVREINQFLANMTALQIKDIKNLIKVIAKDAYEDTKPYYDYRHKSFIKFEDNLQLQKIVKAIARQTADTYINLAKAQAFMIRDLKNPSILIPTNAAEAYQTVIDEAVQATVTGAVDYRTSMRRTMKQLINSGLQYVTYQTESGRMYHQRLDSAVRRNILDGVRAINQGVQDETGKQYGADGIELTVHHYPAPDHAPVQGHQFTKAEFAKMQNGESFVDIKGNKFEGFDRAIGTLNCRHFAYSIILGYSTPNYTDTQLSNILRENEKGYTLPNGKHLTMYQCLQKQNEMAVNVRRAKDGQITALEAGDIELAKSYQAKINKYTNDYKLFSKSCGLELRPYKLTVSGYRKISIK